MNQDAEPESLFRALEEIEYRVAPGTSITVANMVRGWANDVRRFIGNIHTTPIRDAVIWNADDYIGALTMRSMAEEARSQVPTQLQNELGEWLDRIDSDYRGFTGPDDSRLLEKWIRHDVPDDWWWHRVPDSGPVLQELLGLL
jgi:hypothetical protein